MGCSGSKADDLPLVVRCRERRELIRAAADHRFTLAAAHVSYFKFLKEVGDALKKFVDEELITASPSSSSLSSPSLVLPPLEKSRKINHEGSSHNSGKSSSNGGSVLHGHGDEDDESHIHLSDSDEDDDDDEEDDWNHHHHRIHTHTNKDDEDKNNFHRVEQGDSSHNPQGGYNGHGYGYGHEMMNNGYSYPLPSNSYGQPYSSSYFPMEQPMGQYLWSPPRMPQPQPMPGYYSSNSNVYYMRRSAPEMKTVVQEAASPQQPSNGYLNSYWNYPAPYGNGGVKVSPPKEPPPPPSPKATAWDFFNLFDGHDDGYQGYYSTGGYGYGSISSSPDSNEVREREGIPDLEEETENEVYREVQKGKRVSAEMRKNSKPSTPSSRSVPLHKNSEGSSKSGPMHKSEGSSRSGALHMNSEDSFRSVPSWSSEESAKRSVPSEYTKRTLVEDPSPKSDATGSISLTDEKSSSESLVSKSVDEGSVKKKRVSFEVDETPKHEADSSKLSSLAALSRHGTRDIREVVAEIRDDFQIASSYGKEVARMLEVGKVPYHPGFLKVILSRILHPIAPSLLSSNPPSMHSINLASRTSKLAKSYFGDVEMDTNSQVCNLSSTLDKLYAWEEKLYKEVKEEEKLRVMYEKQCKRLKGLDEKGADSGKIEATQAAIRRSLTRLKVSIKAIDAISSRIHELRDKELQPQITELIHGLIRMWKSMLRCHQKQFQAIMESKLRRLRANTGFRTDSNLRATAELEMELREWCERFNDWIGTQKSYVESLNGWLLRCLQYEPEETPDGPVPYSPGRLGAPPIFVICNDWNQAMEAISEVRVANTMNTFASSLRQLWEKQNEEQRQRLKADFVSKDFEKQLRTHRTERGRMELEHHTKSDKTSLSMVPSENGVLPSDDLKVDLDSMRQRVADERIKHKDAIKLVHDAASSSLQGGLVPIFKALENFTSEALKAHEHVRLQPTGRSS
ncbi:unnamed protein product [Fraxinus pennsylvanica]|uniref:Uncharacterized protein n=1 Tax=Fraxinus pennsylvanica TaxID=56036 RepID=A0AAD2EDX1_9LAMI|nr:unnamed protein product [Fraxinus pennsylvanica]